MLLAAIYFWEGSTNTFQTRCGMITLTLLDVAMLTGLKPNNRLGELSTADAISIEFKVGESGKPTYNNFIDFHAKTIGPVSDEEHVAFLTLWLSRYVFCSRSMQVVKQFTPLATQMHRGVHVGLGLAILANLYESLSDLVNQIALFDPNNPKNKNVLAYGPLWLLQLWLNATFAEDIAPFMGKHTLLPEIPTAALWQKLLPLTPVDRTTPNEELFTTMFDIMLTRAEFKPYMAPFADQQHGPKWLAEAPVPIKAGGKNESTLYWRQFLIPQFLPALGAGMPAMVLAHQPNMVARQFGLCQIIPKPLFPSYHVLSDIIAGESGDIVQEAVDALWKQKPQFNPTPFIPSFYCTLEFAKWWQTYFDRLVVGDPAVKQTQLTTAFTSLQAKPTKCKFTHAKQIQAFQKYFKTVYDPNNLRRTIEEAARELRERVTDKIPDLKIPGYAKDKYLFALKFSKMKIPPLPTSPLALAFASPIPDWFYCPISDIVNSQQKPAKRVVPTKHWVDTYPFQLKYWSKCVKPIPEGNRFFFIFDKIYTFVLLPCRCLPTDFLFLFANSS